MYNDIYVEYLWGCYVELNIFLGYMKKNFSVKMEKIKGSWSDKKRYLESYIKEKDFSNIKFEDLAPKDNIKECEEYCDSIEWGIENDKIFNIALTGPYGSGKSSILRTFEKNYIKYKYLNISLASFYEQNQDNKNGEDIELDNEIEKGILQQLFYKIDSKRIPYTRFRKIKNMRIIDMVKNIALIIITIILAILILKPDGMVKFISSLGNIYNYINNGFIVIIIYLSFIYLIIHNIIKVIKYCKSRIKLSALTFFRTIKSRLFYIAMYHKKIL